MVYAVYYRLLRKNGDGIIATNNLVDLDHLGNSLGLVFLSMKFSSNNLNPWSFNDELE